MQAALLLLPTSAMAVDSSPEETALFDRLNTREQILDGQAKAAANATRHRALLAYRISRSNDLGFAEQPETRLDEARTFELALVALRRDLGEARTLTRELDRVRVERSALEGALVARSIDTTAGAKSHPGQTALLHPVRGTPLAVPGARRDGPGKIEVRSDSVEILARLDEPVRAIADGVVKRVEAQPQGGFAVVTAHAGGLTAIVTGLRDIGVKPGDTVVAGQTIGLTGRNLDGAPVVAVEIWRSRRAQDAGKLLRVSLGRKLLAVSR